jgi:hypothetical protein
MAHERTHGKRRRDKGTQGETLVFPDLHMELTTGGDVIEQQNTIVRQELPQDKPRSLRASVSASTGS